MSLAKIVINSLFDLTMLQKKFFLKNKFTYFSFFHNLSLHVSEKISEVDKGGIDYI